MDFSFFDDLADRARFDFTAKHKNLNWDQAADDGKQHYIYRKGGVIVVYLPLISAGAVATIFKAKRCNKAKNYVSIEDFICDYYYPSEFDCSNWHELGAAFNLRLPYEDEDLALEYEVRVKILIERNFGPNSPRKIEYALDDASNVAIFKDYKTAQEYINAETQGFYALKPGEKSKPKYKILS